MNDFRIAAKRTALRCIDKLIEYNCMLDSAGANGTARLYLFRKISREVLKMIEELMQLELSDDMRRTLVELQSVFSNNSGENDKVPALLAKLKRRFDELPAKYSVLFLPYKYSMWDSLGSIYEAAEKDPECEAYVMPIPYYDKDNYGNMTEMYDESSLHPASLSTISWKEHTVDEINPDIIFIHNPYDDRLVVYVPYYVSYTDDPDMRIM